MHHPYTDMAHLQAVLPSIFRCACTREHHALSSTRTAGKGKIEWRTFWLTPQHMPEELLATMPPIMQEWMEDGSGPILYWMSCLPLALCRASSALISPPISPGSTVMLLPSPCRSENSFGQVMCVQPAHGKAWKCRVGSGRPSSAAVPDEQGTCPNCTAADRYSPVHLMVAEHWTCRPKTPPTRY